MPTEGSNTQHSAFTELSGQKKGGKKEQNTKPNKLHRVRDEFKSCMCNWYKWKYEVVSIPCASSGEKRGQQAMVCVWNNKPFPLTPQLMHPLGRQIQRREAAEAEASFSNFTQTHKLGGGVEEDAMSSLNSYSILSSPVARRQRQNLIVCHSPQCKIQTLKKNIEAILIEESIWIELRDKEVRTSFWPGGDNLSFQDEDISRVFSWPWIINIFSLTYKIGHCHRLPGLSHFISIYCAKWEITGKNFLILVSFWLHFIIHFNSRFDNVYDLRLLNKELFSSPPFLLYKSFML